MLNKNPIKCVIKKRVFYFFSGEPCVLIINFVHFSKISAEVGAKKLTLPRDEIFKNYKISLHVYLYENL